MNHLVIDTIENHSYQQGLDLKSIQAEVTELQKEVEEGETKAKELRSYIGKLLGVDCAEKTESQTDEQPNDVDEIKKLFGGKQ